MKKIKQYSLFRRNLQLQKSILSIPVIAMASLFVGIFFSAFLHTYEIQNISIVERMMDDNSIFPHSALKSDNGLPPLLYWIIAGTSYLIGGVTAVSAKLPTLISTVVLSTAFFVFVANRQRFRLAYLATLLLITSVGFHYSSVIASIDMLFTMFVTLTMMAMYRWEEKAQLRGLPWWLPLLISGGILTQGIFALLFPLAAFGIYLFLLGKYRMSQILRVLLYLLVTSLLLPILWYITVWKVEGISLFSAQGMGILGLGSTVVSHSFAWYKVLIGTLIGLSPWIILPMFSVRSKKTDTGGQTSNGNPLYLLSAIIVVVSIFFSLLPNISQSACVLLIYPFAALLMARHVVNLIKNARMSLRIFSLIMAMGSTILIIFFVLLLLSPEQIIAFMPNRADIVYLLNSGLTEHLYLTWGLLIAIGAVVLALLYQNTRRNFTKLMYCNIIIMFFLNLLIDSAVSTWVRGGDISVPEKIEVRD
ncbi:glycosyltransferase family 39 protein [Porphyromonas sp.]|uniref:ArnT family glycosyltransferase n=1 Tax=Porphyromonas sp. TaxID=1924944 RepID=UPI0026DCBCA7|nr:glycosyltransferase family 39 protein [Porphyromonas sp.]MDO4695125.1 glycosyltransferase family 39 protein [Porphyromonas sp.]MDO4770230.1 glycosyltransferase family 39 protein [Porphyromonas sp.]